MTFEIVSLPKKLVYVIGNLVSMELIYFGIPRRHRLPTDMLSVDTSLQEGSRGRPRQSKDQDPIFHAFQRRGARPNPREQDHSGC